MKSKCVMIYSGLLGGLASLNYLIFFSKFNLTKLLKLQVRSLSGGIHEHPQERSRLTSDLDWTSSLSRM